MNCIKVAIGLWITSQACLPAASRLNEPDAGVGMSLINGYVFIEAEINGAGPFRMMIDTGADSCALTPQAARAAGLHYDFRAPMSSVAGTSIIPFSAHNELVMGTVARNEVEIAVLDLSVPRRIDSHVDGVIGQSFLRQVPYLIDYRKKRIWLGDEAIQRSNALPVIVAGGGKSDGTIVPVSYAAGGRSWRLRLDTGTSEMVLACGASCPAIPGAEGANILTNHGATTVLHAVIGDLHIGAARLGRHDALLIESRDPDRDGLLPARWFDAVYVDSANDVARLAPAK